MPEAPGSLLGTCLVEVVYMEIARKRKDHINTTHGIIQTYSSHFSSYTVAARWYSKVVLFYLRLGTISPCLALGVAVRGRRVSRNDRDNQLPWNNCQFKSHST